MMNIQRTVILIGLLFVSSQSYAWFGSRKKKDKEQEQSHQIQQPKEGEKKHKRPAYHGVYSDDRSADSLLIYAHQYLGRPYRGGATGPYSFDCSGFTSYCYRHLGYNLVHSSAGQTNYGMPIMKTEWQPGDLVFFNGRRAGSGQVGHVGIVVRNNGDGTFDFIHAACSTGISIDNSSQRYYAARYVTARRLIGESASMGHGKLDDEFFKSTMMELNSHDDGGEFDTGEERLPLTHAEAGVSSKHQVSHRVHRGETLSGIARQYGCSVDDLKAWNNLSSSRLYAGQALKVYNEGGTVEQSKKTPETKGEEYEVVYDATADKFTNLPESKKQEKDTPQTRRRQTVTTYVISSSGETTVTTEGGETEQEADRNYGQKQEEKEAESKKVVGENEGEVSHEEQKKETNVMLKLEKAAQEASVNTEPEETHIVKVGETLYSISQRHGCSISQLEEWNNLTTTAIRPGQKLKVRGGSRSEGRNQSEAYHTVRKGDTYYSIAQHYHTTVQRLQQLNGSHSSQLRIGDKIRIR